MGVRIVLTSCREATPEFLTMGNDKRQPFWQRTYAIPPGMAFLLGMAIGAVVATGRGVYAPQLFLVQETLDSSGDDSAILRIFWLHALALGSACVMERLQKIASYVALALMLGLLVSFPQVLLALAGKLGPASVIMFMGIVCGLSMFVVGIGWGIIHLLSHLASLTLRSGKPKSAIVAEWGPGSGTGCVLTCVSIAQNCVQGISRARPRQQ